MTDRRRNWTYYLGWVMLGNFTLVFLTVGWAIWLIIPSQHAGELKHTLTTVYGIWLFCMLLAGFSAVKQLPSAYPLTLLATVASYIAGAVWVTVGSWPVVNMVNSGSAQASLVFGDRTIFAGDYISPAYVVDPPTWLLKMLLLTAAFAILLFVQIKHWPRK